MAGDTGAPGYIPLYDDDTSFAPIQNPFNGISQALNAALKSAGYNSFATVAAMNLAPGTSLGQHATVNADPLAVNNGDYAWNGTKWVIATPIHQTLTLIPTNNVNTPASGTVSWPNIGTVNVPTNATIAHTIVNYSSIQTPSTALNLTFQLAIGSTLGATPFRAPGSAANIGSYSFGFSDSVTNPPAGPQTLSVRATFAAGSGVYTLNTGSLITAHITFK